MLSPSSTTQHQPPSTNKSATVGVVGSGTIHQRTWEESRTTVQRVMGRQNLVPAVDPAVACKTVPVPLSHGPGAFGKPLLGQLPMNESQMEAQASTGEIPALRWSKNYEFRCTGEGQEKEFDFAHIITPWSQQSLWPKETLACGFSWEKKKGASEWAAGSSSCVGPKETHFSLSASVAPNQELHDWGRKVRRPVARIL